MAATTRTKESEQIEPPGTLNEHFGASWRRARLTAEQRIARGRDARTKAPRSAHAHWEPAAGRPDPVTLLEEQSKDRVAELIPIRYGRMLLSPFTFFRGAATIMAADLAPNTGVGSHRPAVRRCAPVELRPLRYARAPHALRHQ